MNKRTITILSLVGIALLIVGGVVNEASFASAAASCQGATDTSSCANGSPRLVTISCTVEGHFFVHRYTGKIQASGQLPAREVDTTVTLRGASINDEGCGSLVGIVIGSLLALIGGIAAFIGWILGLVKTAQISRWGWFVAVLLLGSLGSLIYGLAGPAERAA